MIKFLKNLLNKIEIKPEYIVLEKWRPIFKTTDGVYHTGITFKWVKASDLLCSAAEYLMIGVTEDGYIYDKDYIMYPLTNVLAIEWDQADKISILDRFSEFKIVFKDEEVKL